MPTNPYMPDPAAWEIQPAKREHADEISRWIRSMPNGQSVDTQIVAATLASHLEMDRESEYVQHCVGLRNGQLLFYFNGHLKDRIGLTSRKPHKKKDYSVSLLVNNTVDGYEHLYTEIWSQVLKWVFQHRSVGRLITELDDGDRALIESAKRFSFSPLNTAETGPSKNTWYGCDHLDFAPYTDL